MSKRRPAFDQRQGSFDFDTARSLEGFEPLNKPTTDGQLGGIERRIASAVSLMMAETGRSRYDIAGGVSGLLNDDVSKAMLDAYASEARETHNISAGRFFALVAETGAYRILGELLREIGAGLVVGEEILTAELGHKRRMLNILQQQVRMLENSAPLISRGRK